jgi:pantoate kinase
MSDFWRQIFPPGCGFLISAGFAVAVALTILGILLMWFLK